MPIILIIKRAIIGLIQMKKTTYNTINDLQSTSSQYNTEINYYDWGTYYKKQIKRN